MLSVVWGRDGVVKLDFTDQNINSEYYCGLLDAVKAEERATKMISYGYTTTMHQCTLPRELLKESESWGSMLLCNLHTLQT